MNFRNASISTKIAATFVIMLVALGALSALAVNRLGAVNDDAAEMRNNWLPSVGQIGKLSNSLLLVRTAELRVILEMVTKLDPVALQTNQNDYEQAIEGVKKARADYQPFVTPGTEDEGDIKGFDDNWDAFRKSNAQVFAELQRGDTQAAHALYLGTDRANYTSALSSLTKDADFNIREGKKAADKGNAVYLSTLTVIYGAVAVVIVLAAAMGFALSRGVATPIKAMTVVMGRLAQHDLAVAIAGAGRGDEIGAMAKAVEVFKSSMIETDRLKIEQEEAKAHAVEEQHQAMNRMADTFENSVQGALNSVSAAATQLHATAGSMTGTAEEATREATMAASAAEEASTNVQTVAAAAEELSSSISEISRQVARSTEIASAAVTEARRTNDIVMSLDGAAAKIGEVVNLITDIASQTNLLALNATIEAARAGDAGKGFAVVANEVKTLANQTAKATDEIAAQIAATQAATKKAVEAIQTIGSTIGQISEIATSIATAVEEQGAATQEIARNVQQASTGTQQVSGNIVNVSQAASETGNAANDVLNASTQLSREAEKLKGFVQTFLTEVRAA